MTSLNSNFRSQSVPRVTCYCDTDLVHSAYAVTGLIELADAGEIELHFRFRDRALSRRRLPWTLWLRVETAADAVGVCIDTHDKSAYVCPHSLAACRYYYKTNLRHDTFACAAPEFSDRLRPFGPYFPCRPQHDRALPLRTVGNLWAKFLLRFVFNDVPRSLRHKFGKFSWELKRHRRYASRNVWTEYESPPRDEVNPASQTEKAAIVFNPTCWDEAEGDEIRRMNEFRARMIAELRAAFGDRFVGGFRRTGPSFHRYPEALETRTLSHDEYVGLVRDSALAIYTNGKWGCFSWRLPELTAAAKCVVSEPIPNDPGFPLDESVGFVACESTAEMVAKLRRLLDSPETVRDYSQRAWANYENRLRPAARMRRLIGEVLEPADSPAQPAEAAT